MSSPRPRAILARLLMAGAVAGFALAIPSHARAHGLDDLGRGTVAAAAVSLDGFVRPGHGGFSVGGRVSVSHFWRDAWDSHPKAFLDVAVYVHGLRLNELGNHISEAPWRPEGGFSLRVGHRFLFLELGGGLLGGVEGPRPTARAGLGLWFANVVSLTVGLLSIAGNPHAFASASFGYGFRT